MCALGTWLAACLPALARWRGARQTTSACWDLPSQYPSPRCTHLPPHHPSPPPPVWVQVEPADPNEPELRRQLRTRRIAEKHERMARQLAEKRARDEAETAEKAGKVEVRDTLKPKIAAWTAGKKDNIRALLASLHTVLWEGSGWTQPSIADMVDSGRVKRFYMKANLVVHPDKVKQKGGNLEQVATADVVFDVLKAAWGKFEASG